MSTAKGRNKSKAAKAPAPEVREAVKYREVDDIDLTPTFQEALDELDRQHTEAVTTTEDTYRQALRDLDNEVEEASSHE